jgi:hypothetical protein
MATLQGGGTWQTGFYLSDDTTFVNNPLKPGAAAFLFNPMLNVNSNLTVTMTGTVPQTTNVYSIVAGFNLLGLATPISTNLTSALANFTGESDANAVLNDQLFVWSNGTQTFQTIYYFTGSDMATLQGGGTWQTGFYLSDDTTLINVTPIVGQAYFINHQGATEYWTNSFSF